MNDRQILLGLCASLALDERTWPAADDVWKALKEAGVAPPAWVGEMAALGPWLAKEHGVTSLWGTCLYEPEEDDCPHCGRLLAQCDDDYDGLCCGPAERGGYRD